MTQKKLNLKDSLTIGCLLFLLILFFIGLGSSLLHLAISFFLAYASIPVVQWLEQHKLNRQQATAAVVVAVLTSSMLLLLIIVPPILTEVDTALKEAPQNFQILLEKIDAQLLKYGVHARYDKTSIVKIIGTFSQKISMDLVQSSGEAIKNSFLNVMTVIVSILNFFIVPVFFVLLIHNFEGIITSIDEILPVSWRPTVRQLAKTSDQILGGFLRGQVIVCLILSVLYSTALLIAGVKFAIMIGTLTGFLSCIPFVGFSIGTAFALISALLSGDNYTPMIWTVLLYSLVQFCESFIITPKIVGDKVGLTSFEAILALIVFGNLFGFLGLLTAIPCGGILKVIISDLISNYKKTAFYKN